MNIFVPTALFAFSVLSVVAFFAFRRSSAIVGIFAAGWCFLPMASYDLPGLPPYGKESAAGYVVAVLLLFGSSRGLQRLRWHWADALFAIWCMSGALSSLANGLGVNDAASSLLSRTVFWGIPYIAGRLVVRTSRDLSSAVNVIIIFCVAYIPLVLIEARLSPQLHSWVYGFFPHSFIQTRRMGGWRPQVFMAHGLQAAMWMCIGLLLVWGRTLLAAWDQRSAPGRDAKWALMVGTLVGLLAMRSLGAWCLAAVGLSLLILLKTRAGSVSGVLFTLAVGAVLVLRATGQWGGEPLPQLVALVSGSHAGSLEFRLDNEDLLAERARSRWILGWGGWGRSRVVDEYGHDVAVTDGLWIIVFGTNGLVGLASLYGVLLAIPAIAIRRDARRWRMDGRPTDASVVAVVCLMMTVDSIPNAFPIPCIVFMTGALLSSVIKFGGE